MMTRNDEKRGKRGKRGQDTADEWEKLLNSQKRDGFCF